MRNFAGARFILVLLVLAAAEGSAFADDATETARGHYETGLELFYAREHAQALIEFQRAHEVKPRPATVFMMGQCEYLLGSLRQARDHYQAYVRESPTGEFIEVAKDRIESINRRPATLVINTVPDQVDVRIVAAQPTPGPGTPADSVDRGTPLMDPAAQAVTGQAPNNFEVPRGRWVVTVSKANYQSQKITVDVDVADTKPLFFKLDPIPARLEIETIPAGATLYVNGNRVLNPYRHDVAPGPTEVFAEAPQHKDNTTEFVLGPGEKRLLLGPNAFHLSYVQRSGRPELVFATAVMGGLIGAGIVAGAVAAAKELATENQATVNTADKISLVGFTLAGALGGAVVGGLVGGSFVPSYIPDNQALFVIGGMWVGTAEGALTAMSVRERLEPSTVAPDGSAFRNRASLSSELRAAFVGSIPGLGVGVTSGALLIKRAPTYGRVALIQSAALGGAVIGGLTAVALQWNPFGQQEDTASHSILDLSLPSLIGLNVGVAGGLLGAYLPDQSRYGPSWKRIGFIDLWAFAGALTGGIFSCVTDSIGCLTNSSPNAASRTRMAGSALLGGGVGVLVGILTTRNIDQDTTRSSTPPPSLTLLPLPSATGGVTPTLSAVGYF